MNRLLNIYSDYLIAQNQYATAVGLSDLLEGRISHDKITRFLNSNEFSSKELWEYIKPEIRKIEQDAGGVLIFDDTIEEKTYTDENEIICWHYSRAKGRCVKGVNLLSCLVRYGDIALPIAYEPIYKDVLFCDVASKKEKRQSSISKNPISLKDGEKRIAWLKDMSFSVALITKIFKNEDGSTGTLYLVTNDLESSADRIYEIYQKRWRIEEYHKSIKQNASLEKSPTKVMRSQKNHIFASIIAYCKLEFLRTQTFLNHFALKYQLLMKANRMGFLELERLRFRAGCDTIGAHFA